MAEDFDIEAMLEAPFKKEEEGNSSRNNHHDSHREKDRDRRKRSKSRDREKDKKSSKKDKDREKRRDKDRDHPRDRDRGDRDRRDRDIDRSERKKSREKKRSDSREKKRSKSKERERSRSRERENWKRGGGRGGGGGGHRDGYRKRSYSKSPPPREREPPEVLTPEERDARTVFCMQLSARIRPRDLEEFFSSVGKVRDVRIITDNKTRRSKGISYVEFSSPDAVPLAIGLTNQRLLGVPIIVQPSQAEKNRLGNAMETASKGLSGPMRLYVGSLHFNITEDMLRGIFEPFGKIEHINLVMDNETSRSKGFGFVTIEDLKLIRNHETGRSQGYGFVSFHNAEDAKKALEQLNGFELAGRPMKVGHVTERTGETQGTSLLDSDEMDRAGIDLGATGRLQLMAKLAEGTGFEIPQVAANALNMNPQAQQAAAAPPIATQCFMLSNMFDPANETTTGWEQEIKDDVIEECNKHGGALHIYVDKASPQGNVYVKCPTIASAVASVQALHGRWFAGKVITAAYVPLPNYHTLFPDSVRLTQLLLPSSQGLPGAGMLGGMNALGVTMSGIGFAG